MVNSSHFLFTSPNSSYTTDYSFLEHFEFGLVNRKWEELTKVIPGLERCVLKEEIVFVWLELVQKASPNSKCSRKEQSVVYDEFGLVNRKWEELTKVIPG